MKQKFIFLCVIVLFSLFLILRVNGQGIVSIQGRVVNKEGKPIANAKVGLEYPPCKRCLDHIIEIMTTPQEGLFYQDTRSIIGVKEVRLIIEEEVSKNVFRLIYYPSLALSHLPQYRGITINTRKSRDINLGDVLPTISYKDFSIDLSKYIEDIDGFSEVRFSVKDFRKKKVVTKERNIPNSFWKNTSTVNLALPKDRWILEIQYRNRNGRVARKSLLVDATYQQNGQVKIIEL